MDNIKSPEELLELMSSIRYGYVGFDGKKYYDDWENWFNECYVQSGEEVLNSKVGTCWDQVELERLWFSKNNYNFKTIFSWFEHGRDDDMPTHTFLAFKSNDKWFWFENAFEAYRGIHEYNSLEELINDVKSKQFEFAFNNNKNAKESDRDCLVCYEYSKPNYHLGVNDYLSFVTSNQTINERKQ